MSDEAKQIFLQESEELLQEMEDALLMMEEEPEDAEHLNSVFRAMHTIKGSGGIFGFDYIVSFTHPVETELDKARTGDRPVDQELVALLLQCKDHTAALVEFAARSNDEAIPDELKEQGKQLIAELEGTDSQAAPTSDITLADPAAHVEKLFEEQAYAEKTLVYLPRL